jgi:hypothetical protein
MTKLWKDFKPLILIFLFFFGSMYSLILLDQAMGWEEARNKRNCHRSSCEMNQFFDRLVDYWN